MNYTAGKIRVDDIETARLLKGGRISTASAGGGSDCHCQTSQYKAARPVSRVRVLGAHN